jgi:hypothetical protein
VKVKLKGLLDLSVPSDKTRIYASTEFDGDDGNDSNGMGMFGEGKEENDEEDEEKVQF